MTMTIPESTSSRVAPQVRTGPILVATDATAAAEPALRAAKILAARDRVGVKVVSVLEPIAPLPPVVGGVPLPGDFEAERVAALRSAVEDQLASTVAGTDWEVDILQGHPAAVIARVASRSDARLIVLGIGRHDVADRLFGDETALRVLRLSSVPVLAVTPEFSALPTRVLAAVDFSPSSVLAVEFAMTMLGEGATIELAHVAPRTEAMLAPWERFGAAPQQHDFGAALERVRGELEAPPGVTVTTKSLRGSPAQALLVRAAELDAELIVSGSHGYGFLQRMFVGSVATRLLRGSTVPVLIVPQSFASTREAEEGRTQRRVQSVEEKAWAKRLKEFTERNAARRCMLEVDDPSFGAQLQGVDYPLAGVAYDHIDKRVEIMLGDADSGTHLTKNISGVTRIDIVTSPDGRDRVLRIAHGAGQTLLTIG